MATTVRVGLEVGPTWTFASALDWPGWCRRGRGEHGALEALDGYRSRYESTLGCEVGDGPLEVVGSVPGGGATDFGSPGDPGPWDAEPLGATDALRHRELLVASWAAFDLVVGAAPPSLRKGPRGGGRDRDAIVEHVREAERSYARKIGVRVPPRTPWPDQRSAVAGGLAAGGEDGWAWTARYFLRRSAWHVLDHAWEIEDRAE